MQRRLLELMALTLGPAGALRRQLLSRIPALAGALDADLAAMRRALARIATHRHIVLTEDAWRWIAAESDRELLALLVVLATASVQSLGQWHTEAIKALLQSRDLALHLLRRARQDEMIERQNALTELLEAGAGEVEHGPV